MTSALEQTAAAYVAFFETLTDASVEDVRRLGTPDMRYRDPLTDRRGIEAVTAYMHEWFRTMDELRFDVDSCALDGHRVLSRWTMRFRVRRMPKRPWAIEGMSTIWDAS